MKRFFSKRSILAVVVLLAVGLAVSYLVGTRARSAPGQRPLADLSDIETLRTQFNQDAGKTRLIILVSPT